MTPELDAGLRPGGLSPVTRILSFLPALVLLIAILGLRLASAQSSSDALVFGQLKSATGDPIVGSDEIAAPLGTAYSNLEEYLLYYPGIQRPRGVFSYSEILYTSDRTFPNDTWETITLDRAFRIDDDDRVLYIKIVHGAVGNRRTINERIAEVKEFKGLTPATHLLGIVAASGAAATLDNGEITVIFVANGTGDNQMLIRGASMADYSNARLSIILR